jgi:hypothetical protein
VSLLLCLSVPLVFVVARWMLGGGKGERGGRTADVAALAIAVLYASNWFVLETALFVFSEPAFIVVSLTWLAVALHKPRWYESIGWSALLAALAVASMSIRGAGIVCVAATALYPPLAWACGYARDAAGKARPRLGALVLPWLVVLAIGGGYAILERTLVPKAEGSYAHQLVRGLTDGDKFTRAWAATGPTPALLWEWAGHLANLATSHLGGLVQSFVPPYFAESDSLWIFGRPGTLRLIAELALLLAVLGWLGRWVTPRRKAPVGRFARVAGPSVQLPELYVLLSVGLYLVWPFDMVRFWVPLYPLMLAYAFVALRDAARAAADWHAARSTGIVPVRTAVIAATLAVLLVVLNVQNLVLVLPGYQRRLNYVSDCLADVAGYLAHVAETERQAASSAGGKRQAGGSNESGAQDPPRLIVAGADEAKAIAWYLYAQQRAGGGTEGLFPPYPPLRGPRGIERQIVAQMDQAASRPGGLRIFVMSYFTHDLLEEVFANLRSEHPKLFGPAQTRDERWTIQKRLQLWNITAVWEIVPPGGTTESRRHEAGGGGVGR